MPCTRPEDGAISAWPASAANIRPPSIPALRRPTRKENSKTLIFMAPILLPVIFIIPGSVEARFGMPLMVYFLIILFVCSDINKLYHIVKLHWFKTVVLGALLFGLILSIWTNTLMSYNGSYTIWIK